jgi:hypothetical protein
MTQAQRVASRNLYPEESLQKIPARRIVDKRSRAIRGRDQAASSSTIAGGFVGAVVGGFEFADRLVKVVGCVEGTVVLVAIVKASKALNAFRLQDDSLHWPSVMGDRPEPVQLWLEQPIRMVEGFGYRVSAVRSYYPQSLRSSLGAPAGGGLVLLSIQGMALRYS